MKYNYSFYNFYGFLIVNIFAKGVILIFFIMFSLASCIAFFHCFWLRKWKAPMLKKIKLMVSLNCSDRIIEPSFFKTLLASLKNKTLSLWFSISWTAVIAKIMSWELFSNGSLSGCIFISFGLGGNTFLETLIWERK